MDRLRQHGKAVRSLACAVLVRTAKDLSGRSELQRHDALRFCTSAQSDGVFTFWTDASGLGWQPAEVRRRLFKLLSPARGEGAVGHG